MNQKFFAVGNLQKTFVGSGTNSTNNEGEFEFITIFPASVKKEWSFVNIRIKEWSGNETQTKLLLNNTTSLVNNYFDAPGPIYQKNNVYRARIIVNNKDTNTDIK